jgi:hypothetical protein
MGDQEQSGVNGVNSGNIKAVMEARCLYYEQAVESLRGLIETEGVTIENLSKRRQTMLQGLAVDIGRDLSTVARVKIQSAGSSYFQGLLDPFSWYLRDLLNALRMFGDSERGRFV